MSKALESNVADSEKDLQSPKKEEPEGRLDDKKIKDHLSPSQLRAIEKGQLTISKVAEKLKEDAQEAEIHLEDFLKRDVVDLNKYKELKSKIGEIKNSEEMEKYLENIKNLPKKREEEKAKEKEEAKELTPGHPEIAKLQNQFNSICEDNKDIIGLKQVPGFKAWFREEMQKSPTIKKGKEIIKRLEGKDVYDYGGLAPRRAEFKQLQNIFQRHGLGNPLQSDYIKQEGLKERTEYRKNAENLESHLNKLKGTGFYSPKMIRDSMKTMLTARSPEEQKDFLNKAKNIAKKEAENFIHLNSTVTIQGKTIKKMSDASKDMLLQYYKGANFKEREETDLKKLVEHEANLAYKLEAIYENDKEGLHWALESFSLKDFMSKQRALEEHKKLVEDKENKENSQVRLVTQAAHSRIEEAARKKIFSSKTAKNYKSFFEGKEKGKDYLLKNNGKVDLEKLQKGYEILINPSPDEASMNIAAYEQRRNDFMKDLQSFPDLKPEDLEKRLDEYDNEGWSKREKVHEKLKGDLQEAEAERKKTAVIENTIGLDKDEKEEIKESNLKLDEAIQSANELLQDDQAAEALKILLAYNETDPDNPKILFWIETVSKYMREFGSGKKLEKETSKQLDESIEQTLDSAEFEDDMGEIQIESLAHEGAKLHEARHDKEISAEHRGKKESLENTDDEVEQNLIQDFYDKTDGYTLNEEKTGEEVFQADFGEEGMDRDDELKLKREIRREQNHIDTKEGINIELIDDRGQEISAKQAINKEEKEVEDFAQEIAEASADHIDTKNVGNANKAFDKTQQLAMAREAARRKIDERRFEKLKSA